MKKIESDVVVIGAGPAGLSAAVSAKQHGARNVIILDRNSWLGGILPQCIHDGFGVEETGSSMTGPEYAEKYVKLAEKHNIEFMMETMVLKINKNHEISAINKKGIFKIKSKSLVLAMGCREKTRWNILIPGSRPSGIYTAGVAQAFINLYNIMPGKNIVILGSGDVGLIMARRLKFEGANVLGVVEILPHPTGLPRNVVQCLDDYDIPLYLNHTVTFIEGKDRVEKVTIAQVDKDLNPIKSTKKELKCDTLLLSLGLIPENELSLDVGVKIDKITGGPIVNQVFETSVPGVFACGNCLQVYDTVDMLSMDSKIAGENASKYVKKSKKKKKNISVKPGKGVRNVIPQIVDEKGITQFSFRVKKPKQNVMISCANEEKIIFKKKFRWVNPANMIKINVDISSDIIEKGQSLEVSLK